MALIHGLAFPAGDSWGEIALRVQLLLPGMRGWLDPRGGMVLMRVAADQSEIITLAVIPEARRRGVGRGLLQTALQAARAAGANEMFLEVSSENQPALALYVAAGFLSVGRRRQYYRDGTDALVLRRVLADPVPPTTTRKAEGPQDR